MRRGQALDPRPRQPDPTEADAYVFMVRTRRGQDNANLRCPHCDHDRAYYLKPLNGVSRKTRTGAGSQRRVWKCSGCRKQFSVTTATIFHVSKVSLRTWLFVVFQMCASKNGVSAREIERAYGLTPKTASFVLHRLREAMKREPLAGLLGGNSGVVVADETFIGGKPRNKHRQGEKFAPVGPAARAAGNVPAGNRGGYAHKTAVLSFIDTTTGEARSAVVADVTGATLRNVIADQVRMADSVLHTDAGK